MPLKDAVKTFEKQYIHETLELYNGNRSKTARILGIHRNTLQNKLNGSTANNAKITI